MIKVDFHALDSGYSLPKFHNENWQCFRCKSGLYLVSLKFVQVIKLIQYKQVFHIVK